MSSTFQFILTYLFLLGALILLIRSIIDKRRLFTIYYSVYFIIAITGLYLFYNKESNLFTYHFLSVAEILFYTQLFKEYFDSKVIKRNIVYVQVFLVLLAIVLSTFVNKFDEFNTIFQIVESIALISFSAYFFFKGILSDDNILGIPLFWYSSAILLYFSVNIILYSSFYITADIFYSSSRTFNIWLVNDISGVLLIFLFNIGMHKEKKYYGLIRGV